MPLNDLLSPEAILPSLRAPTKKQALQELSEKAAALSGLTAREIFDALLQRERLARPESAMASPSRMASLPR